MVTTSNSPTVLKRWVAFELRRLRESRGVSREEAAGAIRGSVGAIGHIEVGRSLPKPLELDKFLELYGVPERSEFFQELRARAKKGHDWWIGFDETAVPGYFKLFLGLESSAVKIEHWGAQVIPGLFQTPEYARAVIHGGEPELPDAEVSRRVELRMARQQEVLGREDPPTVWSVLAEAALRLRVGGPKIIKAQLEHLLELGRRRTVELQVLPAVVGAHTGIEGAFTILSFPAELEHDPGCVYAETRVRGIYYEEPEQVTMYRDALTRLRVQANKPRGSLALIDEIAKEP